ncbi:hypothetical protein TNCV_3931951 [Trichonephila clavipes]|nr:hypothetical protein TNCV_3931951 [Trichonephila clavipes]
MNPIEHVWDALGRRVLAANHPHKLSKNWKELFWKRNCLGGALIGTNSRRDETILARLHTGHTGAQQHEADFKAYSLLSELQCDPICSCQQLPHLGLYYLP